MKIKIQSLLVLVFFSGFIPVYGQCDVAAIIKKINESYLKQDKMSVSVRYNLYSSYSSQTPYQSKEATSKQNLLKHSYKTNELESISNSSYMLTISHTDKVIMIQKDNNPKPTYSMDKQLKDFLNTEHSSILCSSSGSDYVLDFRVQLPDIERIVLKVNSSNYVINEMIVYYREATSLDDENADTGKEKPRMEYIYRYDLNPAFKESDFDISKFVIIKDKKIRLTQAYSGYRLVNQVED